MESAIVYRNGPVKVGEHSDDLHKLWSIYDSVKPARRTGRLDSVYASPTVAGMSRWTHTNHVNGKVTPTMDMSNYAITVRNPERIFFYDVSAYDNTCFLLNLYAEYDSPDYSKENQELAKEYWDTGIPLLDWKDKAKKEYFDPCEWEALVPTDCIVSYHPIPDKEVIMQAPEGAQEKIQKALSAYNQWMESVKRGENPEHPEKPSPFEARWTYMGKV